MHQQVDRRKVLLWSREPWNQIDDMGTDSMPPGRFVLGVTQTSVSEVAVIGICIPWFGSRTEASRKVERGRRGRTTNSTWPVSLKISNGRKRSV